MDRDTDRQSLLEATIEKQRADIDELKALHQGIYVTHKKFRQRMIVGTVVLTAALCVVFNQRVNSAKATEFDSSSGDALIGMANRSGQGFDDIGVYGHSNSSGQGVYGESAWGAAVGGFSSDYRAIDGLSYTGYGVFGQSTTATAVYGNNTGSTGNGLAGISANGFGAYLGSGDNHAQLYLRPATITGVPTGPHSPGELYVDHAANLYFYNGSWRKVAFQ